MIDICKPPVVWVDGRCYRVNEEQDYSVSRGYTGEDQRDDEVDSEYLDPELEHNLQHPIEELGNSRYRVVLNVAAAFFPQLIGKGGQTKSRLESDTRTKILIPRKGLEGDVVITGSDRSGVATAASRIDIMIESARGRQPFTHFLSIPLATQPVQDSFLKLKKSVLSSVKSRGLDESLFQTPNLLHLTLGTLALLDQRERELARDVLLDCKENVIIPLLGDCKELQLELTGLETMNDDPSEVDVMYIGVKESSGKLQQIVENIVDRFVATGLMKREYDTVKLHCTLLNTLFRKDSGDPGDKNVEEPTARESFDGRPLLEGWLTTSLGKVDLTEIHLSQRRAGRRTAEGYYLPSAVLQIIQCG